MVFKSEFMNYVYNFKLFGLDLFYVLKEKEL